MLDEFDDLSQSSHPVMAHGPRADATARHRFTVARLVSRLYRTASAPLRADMLSCLLRPLGTLSLVAVASGAFARLLQHNGAAPDRVALDEVWRFSSSHIFELAMFVHEENPDRSVAVAIAFIQRFVPFHMLCPALGFGKARSFASFTSIAATDYTVPQNRGQRIMPGALLSIALQSPYRPE